MTAGDRSFPPVLARAWDALADGLGHERRASLPAVTQGTKLRSAASAAQSRPDCCAAVIYLHTAVHRLCLTSPGVTQMSAVTVVRAPTHVARAGAHRQVAARIPTAPRAKQRTAVPCSVLRTVGQHAAGLPAVLQWILRYCRAYGRRGSIFGLERRPRARQAGMPQ